MPPRKQERRKGERRGNNIQHNPPAIQANERHPTIFFRTNPKKYTSNERNGVDRRQKGEQRQTQRRTRGDRRMGDWGNVVQTPYGYKRVELRPEQVQYLTGPKPTIHYASPKTLQKRAEYRELSLYEAAQRNAKHSQYVEGEGVAYFEDRRTRGERRKKNRRKEDQPE